MPIKRSGVLRKKDGLSPQGGVPILAEKLTSRARGVRKRGGKEFMLRQTASALKLRRKPGQGRKLGQVVLQQSGVSPLRQTTAAFRLKERRKRFPPFRLPLWRGRELP